MPKTGQYSIVEINNGTFFSTGISREDSVSGLNVVASYGDTNDPAFDISSDQKTYNTDASAAGAGEGGTFTGTGSGTWTTLQVGVTTPGGSTSTLTATATCDGETVINPPSPQIGAGGKCTKFSVADVCAQATFQTDASNRLIKNTLRNTTGDKDKDGICDNWEMTTADTTNDHAYVKCPTYASVTVDAQKKITGGTIKAFDTTGTATNKCNSIVTFDASGVPFHIFRKV